MRASPYTRAKGQAYRERGGQRGAFALSDRSRSAGNAYQPAAEVAERILAMRRPSMPRVMVGNVRRTSA